MPNTLFWIVTNGQIRMYTGRRGWWRFSAHDICKDIGFTYTLLDIDGQNEIITAYGDRCILTIFFKRLPGDKLKHGSDGFLFTRDLKDSLNQVGK